VPCLAGDSEINPASQCADRMNGDFVDAPRDPICVGG
jgi:hypothetical protein